MPYYTRMLFVSKLKKPFLEKVFLHITSYTASNDFFSKIHAANKRAINV